MDVVPSPEDALQVVETHDKECEIFKICISVTKNIPKNIEKPKYQE